MINNEKNRDLTRMSSQGRTTFLGEMLSSGRQCFMTGRTMKPDISLWWNVCLNNIDGAKEALENGARVNCSGPRGFSPLHIAAEKDNNKMAALLLKHGACPWRDRDPRHQIVEWFVGTVATSGFYLVANQILKKYPDDVTPLEIAADRGNHDFIKLLVPVYRQHREENSYYGSTLVNQDFERAICQAQIRRDTGMHATLCQTKYDILTPDPEPHAQSFLNGIKQRLQYGWRHRFYGPADPKPRSIQ